MLCRWLNKPRYPPFRLYRHTLFHTGRYAKLRIMPKPVTDRGYRGKQACSSDCTDHNLDENMGEQVLSRTMLPGGGTEGMTELL
jgi:hypothetical protein